MRLCGIIQYFFVEQNVLTALNIFTFFRSNLIAVILNGLF